MDPEKKKSLEKLGHTFGSVAQFLGLTKKESIIIETKLSLAKRKNARSVQHA